MINRTLAPGYQKIEGINLIKPEKHVLDNGVPVFAIKGGDQELIRVEFIFENVEWDPSRPLETFATNNMLNDGTSKYTADEIAEQVDFYGAFMQTECAFDQATLTLYTLNKHLESVLPIIKSVLSESQFPDRELAIYKTNNKQKLSVNLQKNDFIARQELNRILFGSETLYGHKTVPADYDKVERKDLLAYFSKAYNPSNCTIIIAGKTDEQVINLLNFNFGKSWEKADSSVNNFSFEKKIADTHFFGVKDSVQAAVRLGQLSLNRNHPDFPKLQVLNTLFGGYFGSRLMGNIREDKGYTYGIGSAVVSMKNQGYMFIASQVGIDVCDATLTEIEKEAVLLQQELVPADELDLVKNYMLGSFLGSLENAFSHADKFKNVYFSGLDYDYYERYIQIVKSITAEELKHLAVKYLNYRDFDKVIVGKS